MIRFMLQDDWRMLSTNSSSVQKSTYFVRHALSECGFNHRTSRSRQATTGHRIPNSMGLRVPNTDNLRILPSTR